MLRRFRKDAVLILAVASASWASFGRGATPSDAAPEETSTAAVEVQLKDLSKAYDLSFPVQMELKTVRGQGIEASAHRPIQEFAYLGSALESLPVSIHYQPQSGEFELIPEDGSRETIVPHSKVVETFEYDRLHDRDYVESRTFSDAMVGTTYAQEVSNGCVVAAAQYLSLSLTIGNVAGAVTTALEFQDVTPQEGETALNCRELLSRVQSEIAAGQSELDNEVFRYLIEQKALDLSEMENLKVIQVSYAFGGSSLSISSPEAIELGGFALPAGKVMTLQLPRTEKALVESVARALIP